MLTLHDFDKIITEKNVKCPRVQRVILITTRKFNMMFKVGIGPEGEEAYLRPETCQSIFVDFPTTLQNNARKTSLRNCPNWEEF